MPYQALKTPKLLPSETNTRAVERRIRSAYRWTHHTRFFETYFEHGQWWVFRQSDGVVYSVVDTGNGFDFERIG